MNIYLAGPLFTLAEQMFNAELAAALGKYDHQVWLPQDHDQSAARERATFNRDIAAIDGCDIVVANMDGPDPDSGTCWECGYAYARGIPLVIFRTDWRSAGKAGPNSYNLMMTQSADERLRGPFADLGDLAQQLDAAIHRAARRRSDLAIAAGSGSGNQNPKPGRRRKQSPATARRKSGKVRLMTLST